MRYPSGGRAFFAWVFSLVLTCVSISVGCSRSAQDSAALGQTTVLELKERLGEPDKTTPSREKPQAKLLAYRDGCVFQAERNVIVSSACKPAADEARLQTWLHRWAEEAPRLEALPGAPQAHGRRMLRLVSVRTGTSVIYDEASDRVIQVVKHGAR